MLALLLVLSTVLLGSDCSEPEAVPLEELRKDVAPAFDYGLYSDDKGRLKGERSAVFLVYRSSHLERVYADAQSGNQRAQALVRQLEATFHASGVKAAAMSQGLACPALPACAVKWQFLDELVPSRQEGGTRLREQLADGFVREAPRQQVSNVAYAAALNVLLVGSTLKVATAAGAEARAAAGEARVGAAEAGQVGQETALERRLALPGAAGRLAAEEAVAVEARLVQAEALEARPRYPSDPKVLVRYRPSRTRPHEDVSPDNPLWPKYVAYWERRYEELADQRTLPAGQPELKGPLKWKPYEALMDRFGHARSFQDSATRALQREALAAQEERVWLRGMKKPRVDENVGLAHEGGSKRTFVDQLVVDEATLGAGQRPVVHSFSNKQHDFSATPPKAAIDQFRTDFAEARAKYAGTVEIRRPGHPLFGRKVVVSRVHLVYDGKALLPAIRRALTDAARDSGVELHFHVQ
jgi:hypothetical protein